MPPLPMESVEPLLREQGYFIDDPWDVVDTFEKKVAAYAGAKLAVSVDSCTNALFLCLKYLRAKGEIAIPAPIMRGIGEHHGTSIIRFFYEKAKELMVRAAMEPDNP